MNTILLLPLFQKSDLNCESNLHVQVQLSLAPGRDGGELPSLEEIITYPPKGRTLLEKPQNSLWWGCEGTGFWSHRDLVVFPLGRVHMLTGT